MIDEKSNLLEEQKEISADPIKHVVLLMLENHSFDQMLGCFQQIYPDLEGINPKIQRFNLDKKRKKVYQKEIKSLNIPRDPMHELPNVLKQIDKNNSGFIINFMENYPKSTQQDRQNVMGYYPLGFLPALHSLAAEYTICDHWFSSVPGPTWPNRFFALSGSSAGKADMPENAFDKDLIPDLFTQNQPTLFDRLNEVNKKSKIYYHDFPISLVFTHQRELTNLIKYSKIENFYEDTQRSEEEFPDFVFIEPKYLGHDENDDHPPHNTMRAQKLIADVYNTIRANTALWESTLLVITYDEHGGFYDHVPPPSTIAPDDHTEDYPFDRLGVRVPTVLVSPWVKKGVEKTIFGHTSLLKYLIDKWQLKPLGARAAQANSIACALNFSEGPRKNCRPHYIQVPGHLLLENDLHGAPFKNSSNQNWINNYANFLRKENNIQINYERTALSRTAQVQEKIGRKLVKFGLWMQKKAQDNREKNFSYTCDITQSVLGLKP